MKQLHFFQLAVCWPLARFLLTYRLRKVEVRGRLSATEVTMIVHRLIANERAAPSARQGKTCRELVEQAENLVVANSDKPVHITALCHALAVSERTLRTAFHRIHGLPPCRHLRMLRLSQAKRSLLAADRRLVTVTEIATCFGFLELGRFSVEYRKVFGESPSETLSRSPPVKVHTANGADRHRGGFALGAYRHVYEFA
jgi:transcriptional regulator GlxA family with amidase domain